ncbi:hypothetical protein NKI51_10750 [Mesorhizobium australicum]|uniref:hypothetical protein n=1 Tax=Mesorhizobium australicum TaxID=536018 RepID=UPI00333BB44E
MFWNIVIGILSYALQLALTPKPQNAKPKSLEDFQAPTAEEGREIPVVFGTSDIADPNVTWYGDLGRSAIKGARRYGLFGPRQVLGYKYSLGMQMGLCHAVADCIYRITIGDKTAWRGVSTGGRITINKSGLFGGDQSEGGIQGSIDLNMGDPDQAQNDYLASKLGATISAFRGIVTVVLRHVYLGTSNYIKPWEFRLQRIHLKSDGSTQWYDAKAAVPAFEISDDDTGVELSHDATGSENHIDTNGDYGARGAGGQVNVWHLPDGAEQSITPAGHLFVDSVHITDFDELVVRTGGDISGISSTALEFRDVANPSATLQSIDLNAMIEDSGAIDLNFGFYMDDVSVGGVAYALVKVVTGGASAPWILLGRSELGSWSVSSYHSFAGATGTLTSLSMGPTYAYGVIDNDDDVVRLTWNGSWARDRITLPGFSGITHPRAINYNEATGLVTVVNDTGIFVYSADLSTLIRSSTGLGSVMGYPMSSKRMSMPSGTVVLAKAPSTSSPVSRIYFVPLSDLSLDSSIVISDTSYVRKTVPFKHFLYNQNNGIGFLAGPTYTVAWPIAATVFDMNPAHIIRECLTDGTWGMGYNDSDIDDISFTACADTFYSELFGLSLRWSQEEEIQEFVSTILSHVDAYLYVSRSTGKFVLKAIRNDYDIDAIPVVTEDDVVEWTEVDHRSPSEAVSSVLVKFYYREKRKDGAHLVTNLAQAMQATKVMPATRSYPGINRSDLAIKVATRDVIALGSGLTSGRLVAKRTIEGMNPGDAFRLVSDRHELSGEVMRVADLNFGDGRQNKIGLKFFQDVFHLGAAVLVDNTDSPWEPPSSTPLAVNPRLVWEMPYREMRQMIGDADLATLLAGDAGAGLLQVAGVSPSADAANADVKVDAGAGYAGTEQMDFAPGGFLDGDVAAEATEILVTGAIGIDQIEIGTLASLSGTEAIRIEAIDGNTLTVSRGMLDMVPQAHVSGASLVAFDDLSTSDFEAYTDGESISVKLLTNTGQGQLVAAPTDTVLFASRGIRPLRPANVQVNSIGYGLISSDGVADLAATWAERNRLIELDSLSSWTDATVDPEDGQTTVIEVLDPTGTSILTTHSGLTGTSFAVPTSSFGGNPSGWVQFGAERDGYRQWHAYKLQVVFNAVQAGSFILTGNGVGLSLTFPLSVATGAFTLTGNAAALHVSMPAATGAFTLTGNDASLNFSAGITAATGSFALTGNAATLAAPFSPLDLPNLNSWYDPSDDSTLTVVSSEVDFMADKSGNGYTVSAPSSTRRANKTTINGVQALTYNSDYLTRTTGMTGLNGTDLPLTYFEVIQPANVTQNPGFHMSMRGSNVNQVQRVFQTSAPVVGFGKTDSAALSKTVTGSGIDTTPQIITVICTGTLATVRRNGVDIVTNGDVDVATMTASRFTLAADFNGVSNSSFYIGKIGECALCVSALGSTDVGKMEAYLAAKWGITI